MVDLNAQIMTNAASYYDEAERPGPESDPLILSIIHRVFQGRRDDTKVPWCSLFCIEIAENVCAESTLSLRYPALARSWLDVGVAVPLKNLRFGDVVVLWRGSPEGSKGHVGFFVRRKGDRIYLLGGNQGNRVCVADYSIDRFLGGRRLRLKSENVDVA